MSVCVCVCVVVVFMDSNSVLCVVCTVTTYTYTYICMYMYVHAIQYVSCSQMLEVVYIISPIVYVRIHCSHIVGCIH